MDNEAYAELGQNREQAWDRSLHTKLFNKLADDGCSLVVADILFRKAGDAGVDQALAGAIHRLTNVVLAAAQAKVTHPDIDSARPTLPLEIFLNAARTNWGVAWLDPDLDMVVRHHWPFPSPGPYPSLPRAAASLLGAQLDNAPSEKWIRYYDSNKTCTSISYHLALAQSPGYFRNRIVFIGNQPKTPLADGEEDKFQVPQTRWTGEAAGGVEILAAEFLNLVNGDWLRRMAWPVEGSILILSGVIFGGVLCRFRRSFALALACIAALLLVYAGVCLSNFTNYWFPWLIVAGGQLPCALVWALIFTTATKSSPMPDASSTRMARDVFISYASHDKAIADAACAALETQGIRCWIAPRDVLAGTEYGEAILSAIEECRVMVLIFSVHANESPHIRRETERAVSKRKFIVTFRIQNVLPSGAMEYCLSNTHWLDAVTPPLEGRIRELVASVSRLLERKVDPSMQPPDISPGRDAS